MRRLLVGIVLILGVSALVAGQRGQRQNGPATPPAAPNAAPLASGDDQTISVNVDLVNIPVTVADRKGKFVTNLKKEDFKVFEDERVQSITNFSSRN